MGEVPEIHLLVAIGLAGDGFPDAAELRLRYRLEEAVEAREIGEIVGGGGGAGGMDISVLVRDEQAGRERLAALVRELAPGATFRIITVPDEEDEEDEEDDISS